MSLPFRNSLATVVAELGLQPFVGNRSVKKRVYAQQLDVSLRLAPFAVFSALIDVLLHAVAFWNSGPRVYLSFLAIATIGLSTFSLRSCWRWRRRAKQMESRSTDVHLLIFVSAAFGILLGSIPVVLFVSADANYRLLIACSDTGLIAIGLSVFAIPRASLSFTGVMIAASFYTLATTDELFYILIALLLALYTFFIFSTIFHLSKILLVRIVSEIKVEQQKDVISLLLYDFEESASDWIWEIDLEKRIRNPSSRLAQVSGKESAELDGMQLSTLLSIDENRISPAHIQERLWKPIDNGAPFRDCLLPVMVGGHARWWSLTGKALFDADRRISGYRGVASDVTAAKDAEERLSHLARFDALTGLPNRTQFYEQLQARVKQAPISQTGFAVLCLDLDEFKYVNDTFGHAIGDRVLIIAARRFQDCLDHGDIVARLSGDEFAILTSDDAANRAEELATRISAAIAEPMLVEGIKISVHVSIGIAVAPSDSVGEILHRADLALYRAKQEGRNSFRFYDAEMDANAEARRRLAADIRGALSRGEFSILYQPVVACNSLKTEGFEALLRWRHPTLGMVAPSTFIPIAEENATIVEMGEWVIRESCRVAATWPGDVKIAVNLSPVQLRYSELCAIVASALSDSGLEASRLELEITESMVLEGHSKSIHALQHLQQMGVRLALDDFGTGYSSLSYLRKMRFNKIKIDRSFVQDLPNDTGCLAVVRAVIGLGESLEMTITAEGVETAEQLACLRREGCDLLQGFLFSPAKHEDQLQGLMDFSAKAGGASGLTGATSDISPMRNGHAIVGAR